MNRNTTIVVSVVALHLAALWAMQAGLMRRVVEVVVPVSILVEIKAPRAAPVPVAVAQPEARPTAKPVVRTAPTQTPVAPVAIAETPHTPAPSAMAPASVAPAAAPASTATARPSPAAAPARIELPSSHADYLNNPKPDYPKLSVRLGEQGTPQVRVTVGVDGAARKVALEKSSGFPRLDQLALNTAKNWRYVPGKRGGVIEEMDVIVPMPFVLNE